MLLKRRNRDRKKVGKDWGRQWREQDPYINDIFQHIFRFVQNPVVSVEDNKSKQETAPPPPPPSTGLLKHLAPPRTRHLQPLALTS